jgi:hypothetical protein
VLLGFPDKSDLTDCFKKAQKVVKFGMDVKPVKKAYLKQ